MRKKAIIILIVIIAIFAVFAFFARDRYLERAVERTGELIAGARVEVDNFHFSLFKMTCSWDRLQVANKNNPWYNIVETGKASFVVETRPLFWKRIIIKEMVLQNVINGTKRTSDGSLPKKEVKQAEQSEKPGMVSKVSAALKKQAGELPVFDLSGLGKKLKVDSLIDVNNLKTVQEYQNLKQTADSVFTFWQAQPKPETYLTRVKGVEDKVKTLRLDEIKDLPSLTSALSKLEDVRKEVKTLKKEVDEKHDNLKQSFNEVQSQYAAIQSGLKEDIDRAKQLAKLKELDVKDVSMLLFGEPVMKQSEKLLSYVSLGRRYLPTAKKALASKKVEKPPRFKGQDIHFPFHYRYPRFLLREAKLSAATAGGDTSRAFFLEGDLFGMTNEPAVYGKPTRFKLELKKVAGNLYDISGSLDHTKTVSHDSLWVSAKNFGLGEVKLKESKYFPKTVQAQKGDVKLAGFFIGDGIDLELNLKAAPIEFFYEKKASDRISQIVRDVLAGLNQLTLKAELVGDSSDYKLRMNSNVDNLLANQIKKTLEKNLREAQQQVEDYVKAEVDKRRKEVESLIEKNKQILLAEMDKAKQKVQEQYDELEKRKQEVQKRIEEEKKKA